MGLLDDTPERWDRFRERIAVLNEELKGENAEVKVFFFARHGQGWRKTFLSIIPSHICVLTVVSARQCCRSQVWVKMLGCVCALSFLVSRVD